MDKEIALALLRIDNEASKEEINISFEKAYEDAISNNNLSLMAKLREARSSLLNESVLNNDDTQVAYEATINQNLDTKEEYEEENIDGKYDFDSNIYSYIAPDGNNIEYIGYNKTKKEVIFVLLEGGNVKSLNAFSVSGESRIITNNQLNEEDNHQSFLRGRSSCGSYRKVCSFISPDERTIYINGSVINLETGSLDFNPSLVAAPSATYVESMSPDFTRYLSREDNSNKCYISESRSGNLIAKISKWALSGAYGTSNVFLTNDDIIIGYASNRHEQMNEHSYVRMWKPKRSWGKTKWDIAWTSGIKSPESKGSSRLEISPDRSKVSFLDGDLFATIDIYTGEILKTFRDERADYHWHENINILWEKELLVYLNQYYEKCEDEKYIQSIRIKSFDGVLVKDLPLQKDFFATKNDDGENISVNYRDVVVYGAIDKKPHICYINLDKMSVSRPLPAASIIDVDLTDDDKMIFVSRERIDIGDINPEWI